MVAVDRVEGVIVTAGETGAMVDPLPGESVESSSVKSMDGDGTTSKSTDGEVSAGGGPVSVSGAGSGATGGEKAAEIPTTATEIPMTADTATTNSASHVSRSLMMSEPSWV